ncbi:MAG: indolepyruvate ferredoxin oxidoreductase family protein [Alphaproteobacteria bacterium]|nr:indolepyruvate ferredoxin oxidoreductase family protein [Alphaproteobacteria bacterium]
MHIANVTLEDKYTQERGRVFLTGTQALVRLPMMQRARDLAQGLNTAGFISGYRGSPLGGFDKELWSAKKFLKSQHIHFQPGVNEDLAATACWGTQQVNLFEGAKYDGVFAIWYGKGPGVDRSGDVFKHGNNAGTSQHGGVLALAGDDHAAKSSTAAHQSDYAFMDAMIPVLHPAGVQEILDYGLFGIAMSRFAGLWVAMKTIAETVDSSASVQIDPLRLSFVIPDFDMPPGGLHIRWPDKVLDQESRLMRYKLDAALAFARANRIDRTVIDCKEPRLGIVATGKAYLDVRQALDDLGIDDQLASEIGLRLYKVGMVWPLEREGIRHFAEGLEEILVVEEKRPLIENQLKEQLYNWREDVRPRVIGKYDEEGKWLLASNGELSPAEIAKVIAARIDRFMTSPVIKERLDWLKAKEDSLSHPTHQMARLPYFCSGCPHNTSTRVPEGSRALAGIGCHYMATWMDRKTETFTQMGGEGATWIGQAPFTETKHVFQNLGDGTYFHSGILALRAAISAGVNITYKILYNDAVAMTGGQPLDGQMSVPQLARQVEAEGVARIAIVSDEPHKYPIGESFPPGTSFHHRDYLDQVQRELRDWPGVSVLIYDQTCAAEKRRRRKRGKLADPEQRLVINERICEGCGDCGEISNCVSVVPVETEYGRKRAIDQSSCNKDYSCVKGFCPSFVSVIGARPRKRAPLAGKVAFADLPDPELPKLGGEPYGIVITGIGGTGVVTVGALLGMAAHLEGLGVSVLDMLGMAQKNGAVLTHVRLAPSQDEIHAVRIGACNAHLLLGCDMVVAAGPDAVSKLRLGHASAVVNDHTAMTADFTRKPDLDFPAEGLKMAIIDAVGREQASFVDASRLAASLLGDALATNLFMVGFAWQKGLIPLSHASLEQAISLNGAMVEFNKQAFLWGRRAAFDLDAVAQLAAPPETLGEDRHLSQTLDQRIARRKARLADYQDQAYAERYARRVAKIRHLESVTVPGSDALAWAAADSLFKLMAIKDEYEVARLMVDPQFLKEIQSQFEGPYRLKFHLAPPVLAAIDDASGRPRKSVWGGWMMPVFKLLAGVKGIRNSWLDPFRYARERRMNLRLLTEYEQLLDGMADRLSAQTLDVCVELAALPMSVRGYGPVKEAAAKRADQQRQELLARLDAMEKAA